MIQWGIYTNLIDQSDKWISRWIIPGKMLEINTNNQYTIKLILCMMRKTKYFYGYFHLSFYWLSWKKVNDRLPHEEGSSFSMENVLLVSGNGDLKIGAPHVSGAEVTAKVLSHTKGDKVLVFKKKSHKASCWRYDFWNLIGVPISSWLFSFYSCC